MNQQDNQKEQRAPRPNGAQPGAYPPPPYGAQPGAYPPPPYGAQPGAYPPPYGAQPCAYPPPPYGARPGAYPPPYGAYDGARGGAYSARGAGVGKAFAKKRRNFAPLVVTLLCLALAATVFLFGEAVDAVRDSGVRTVRPTPGEVPSFTIDDLPDESDGGLSTVEISKKVSDSVVCINVYQKNSLNVVASGSGVIFNEEGFIVTNAHVVEGAPVLTVQLNDGRELNAWLVGADARTDLAVIKVTAEGLVPASFGDSDQLQVGERAIVIGNAAGMFANTVTQGVISGLNREVSIETETGVITMRLIQTSAAINPGNSGGALVNRFGQVIGITSSKMNSSRYEGLGFAIPSADAQPIVGDLIDYGYVKDRVALGVMLLALTPATGPANGLPSQGLYITEVEEYSDLNNHDVTAGDVILTADGETLETVSDLLDVLETHKPGETVTLQIQKHGSGRVITVDAVLAEARND